mmetsp:Transcript_88270/g.273508  ORF Transcript_88270/g.273508 Transcript_88270/m.273508 type:complete len:304 (-) Transcript_88270:83-994(-)
MERMSCPPTRRRLAALVGAAAAWLAGAGLRDVAGSSGAVPRAGVPDAVASGAHVGMAFAWPTRPMKTRQGPTKRSKQALIGYLKDPSTYEGKTKWAIKLMRKFKFFTTSWEYVLAMKKLTQVGAWDDALVLWDEMLGRGIEPNSAAYSAAIVALNTGREWEKAIGILDDMELRDMAPIRIGCEHALMACERGRLWKKALHLLDLMWEHGMAPNEESYMPAIRTCENAGQFAVGDTLFRQMRERTKLERVEQEVGFRQVTREPPQAPPAPWRLPGAIALDAFDPPKLKPPRERPRKKLPQGRDV